MREGDRHGAAFIHHRAPVRCRWRQAEAKGLTLRVSAPGERSQVSVDRVQIERVISNLVTNAIRATERGGTIDVSAMPRGGFVAISVRDTGRGIPPDYLDRIFEPFVQAPNAAAGGAGLGLSISRRIVQAHGGRLQISSEANVGTTVRVSLPAWAGSAQRGSAAWVARDRADRRTT